MNNTRFLLSTFSLICLLSGLQSCTQKRSTEASSTDSNDPITYKSFLYVAENTADKIGVYEINETSGALTLVEEKDVCDAPKNLAKHPTKDILAITCNGSTVVEVETYSINSATGALTAVDSHTVGSYPTSLIFSSTGAYLYVSNRVSTTISVLGVSDTGALTSIQTANVGYGPWPLAISKDGAYLWAGLRSDHLVAAFDVSSTTGELSLLGMGNVTSGNPGPIDMLAHPSLDVVYVANIQNNHLDTHSIDTTQTLKLGSETSLTLQTPIALAMSPNTSYLLGLSYSSTQGSLVSYAINSATGALTATGSSAAVGAYPLDVAVAGAGNFAYVSNNDSTHSVYSISILSFSSSDGTLSASDTLTLGSTSGPEGLLTVRIQQ